MRYVSLLLALLTPFCGVAVYGCEAERSTDVLVYRPLDRGGEHIRAAADGTWLLTDGNYKELFRARRRGGAVIGFERDPGGRPVALAGTDRLPLAEGEYVWRYVRPVELVDVPKFAGEAILYLTLFILFGSMKLVGLPVVVG